MSNQRPDYSCRDCGVDIDDIDEYSYMVKDEIWRKAVRRKQAITGPGSASVYDMLCIECLEERLGRQLTKTDFNWHVALTNDWDRTRSIQLQERMHRSVASAP